MEVIEPGGIEGIGWTEDGGRYLYRTEVREPHEGAVIGVVLGLDGSRVEYLVSQATDPGTVPALRDALVARGVLPDPAPFHALAARATWELGLAGACGASPTTLSTPEGSRWVVRPRDGRAWAEVTSTHLMGEGPATLTLERIERTLDIARVPGDEALVAALRARIGERWRVTETVHAGPPPERTTMWTNAPAAAAWWAELELPGEPNVDRSATGCPRVALVPR